MPRERERKFILNRNYADLQQILRDTPAFESLDIEQVYLKQDARLRATRYQDGTVTYHHTSKYPLGPDEQVEIEPEISAADYTDISRHHTDRVLYKTRFAAHDNAFKLDVDFLRVAADPASPVYFALLEIEFPSDWAGPIEPPSVLQPHILYTVPEDETRRYSNYKLASREYAENVLKGLLINI